MTMTANRKQGSQVTFVSCSPNCLANHSPVLGKFWDQVCGYATQHVMKLGNLVDHSFTRLDLSKLCELSIESCVRFRKFEEKMMKIQGKHG